MRRVCELSDVRVESCSFLELSDLIFVAGECNEMEVTCQWRYRLTARDSLNPFAPGPDSRQEFESSP